MKTTLIALMILAPTLAYADGIDGRAYYHDQPEALKIINESVAKEMNLPVLPLPKINLVDNDPLSPFGDVQSDGKGKVTVTLTQQAKLYHTYHEMVHYYQFTYHVAGDNTCAKPYEIQPMILSSKWCETNNCPVKKLAELKEIAGCK